MFGKEPWWYGTVNFILIVIFTIIMLPFGIISFIKGEGFWKGVSGK